jgi:hypothetical protein
VNVVRTSILIFSLLILAGGCVTDGDEVDSGHKVTQSDPDVVCRTENPTGSRITRKRCWSRDDYDAMVRATEDEMRRRNQRGSSSGGGEN